MLLAACGGTPSAESIHSGIEGIVLLGPNCPVVTPDSPCPDRPVKAEISLIRAGSDQVAAVFTSGEDGKFRKRVATGNYEISSRASGAMFCKPEEATVEEHKFTSVTVHCVTGIR